MLETTLRENLKEAMKAKDAVKLTVIRSLFSAFTNELVAKGKKPTDKLTEEEMIAVIRRLMKQRLDSIEQFENGGRSDLAANEKTELVILEAYVPKLMPKEEVFKLAEAKKNELGISDKAKAGMLMAALMKDLRGKADGKDVKEAVDSLLA